MDKSKSTVARFWLRGGAVAGLFVLTACGGAEPDGPAAKQTEALTAPTSVPAFVFLSTGHVSMQDRTHVNGGHIGVSAGAGDSVNASFDTQVAPGFATIGQRIVMNDRAAAGDLFVTTPVLRPSATFTSQSPFSAPPAPPPIVTVTPGTTALTVNGGQTVTRAAGNFGQVTVNGTLNLSGGTYNFAQLTLGNDGAIIATGPSIVRVAGKVTGGERARIQAGGSQGAGAFRLTVAGSTSATGGVSLGNDARLNALVMSRVGFSAKDRFIGSGAIGATDIALLKDSTFTFNTGFGCNSDAACSDGNPCTVDSCSDGQCLHPNAANGTTCTDDGNQCTTDTCNAGACQHPSKTNGTSCTLPNAAAACSSGTCTVTTCNAGFSNCDSTSANGCEINTATSVTNCGTCGNACSFANAAPACTAGTCAIGGCNPGFGNCNGTLADGCEADLNGSVGNCGSCGNTCSFANAGALCTGGSCAPGACNPGFLDCDTSAGCETNGSNDANNCGTCGHVCSLANATAGCANGACFIPTGGCNAGYSDCDGNAANGCETALDATCNECGCQFSHTCQGTRPGVVFNDDGLTPGNPIDRDLSGNAIVPMFGYVYSLNPIDPNTRVIVSVLQNQGTNNPAECAVADSQSSAVWREVASIVPAATPSFVLPATYVSLFRWSADVSVTPTEWPDGGVVRFKVSAKICNGGTCVEDLTGNAAQFDDDACVAREYTQGYESTTRTCAPTSMIQDGNCTTAYQIVTYVDTDPVIEAPLKQFCSNNGHTASNRFLWDEEPSTLPNCDYLADSNAYYAALDSDTGYTGAARDTSTLPKWLAANGFPQDEVRAAYYNAGDIGVGRDMHCRRDASTGIRSCYVSNYLPAVFTPDLNPEDDQQNAVYRAIHQDPAHKVATVAMEWLPNTTQHTTKDVVRFWVFDDKDARVPQVTLDSEGNKPVPGVCLTCHAGEYPLPHVNGNGETQFIRTQDAKFLPFDACAFVFSKTEPGYSLAEQRDAFQKLNAIVLETQPYLAAGATPEQGSITELIYGMYGIDPADNDGVNNPLEQIPAGTAQDENWTPDEWIGRGHFYLDVIKPYCRTCHVAQEIKAVPDSLFGIAATDVCGANPLKRMPHAEATLNRLWQGSGRAELVKGLNTGFNGMITKRALGCAP